MNVKIVLLLLLPVIGGCFNGLANNGMKNDFYEIRGKIFEETEDEEEKTLSNI